MIAEANQGRADLARQIREMGLDASLAEPPLNAQPGLFAAIEAGDAAQTQALLAGGASPGGFDPFGRTPLVFAIQRWAQGPRHQDVVRALLAAGVRPDQKAFDDWTPLMHAASQGHADACTLLLDAGANADVSNLKGRTALMIAANRLHEEAIAALLARGAAHALTDIDGRGALDLLSLRTLDKKKIKRCRKLLTDAGATTGRASRGPGKRARPGPKWLRRFSADELTQAHHRRVGGLRYPVWEVLLSLAAVGLISEGRLEDASQVGIAVLVWAALSLAAFPSIVQLPWLLLARPAAAAALVDVPETPASDGDPEFGAGQLDAVSNFMRLGWGAQVRLARSRQARLMHTRSHLASIGLAFAIGLAIVLAAKPVFDNWIVTAGVMAAVTVVALMLEDRLRQQRLKAFQASRDHVAAEINQTLAQAASPSPPPGRAFVLYLRTFGVTGLLNIGGLDFESSMAYNLAPMMPMIALGHPGEAIGAGRILTTDEHWREEILRLVDKAERIMLIPSHREGTKWEIAKLKENQLFGKTIFAMPPEMAFGDGRYSDEWNRAAAALAPIGVTLPPHYSAGLLFTLGPDGVLADHAPLQAARFVIDLIEAMKSANWNPTDANGDFDGDTGDADISSDGGDGGEGGDGDGGGGADGAGSADGSRDAGGQDAGGGDRGGGG